MVSRKKPLKICLSSIVFLIPLLLMFGCNIGGNKTKTTDINPYHVGTQGVVLAFEPNMPPSTDIPSTGTLSIAVRANNRGAYTIESGDLILVIGGYDPSILPITDNEQSNNLPLDGKSEIYATGGYDVFTWDTSDMVATYMGDEYKPELKVTACYIYQTEATAQVCIDPDPYSSVETSKICKPGTLSASVSGGQGAPVVVTSVQEKIMKDKVSFIIQLANLGGGTVIDSNALGDCVTKDLQILDLDVVRLDAAYLGGNIVLTCKPGVGGVIKLSNNKGTIYCEASQLSMDRSIGAYKTKLQLVLDYGYTTSISKPIRIVNTERLDFGS